MSLSGPERSVTSFLTSFLQLKVLAASDIARRVDCQDCQDCQVGSCHCQHLSVTSFFTQPHLCTVQGAVAAFAIGDIARADCKDARVALIQHLAMPDMPWWKICRIFCYATTVIRIHRICCTTAILQNTTTKHNTSST